jgi:hypothetical protein
VQESIYRCISSIYSNAVGNQKYCEMLDKSNWSKHNQNARN